MDAVARCLLCAPFVFALFCAHGGIVARARWAPPLLDAPRAPLGELSAVSKAIYHDGRFWLLGTSGDLTASDPTTRETTRHLTDYTVVDLHATESGALCALTVDGTKDVRIWQRRAARWEVRAQMRPPDTRVLAFTDLHDRAIVLTSGSAFLADGPTFGAIPFDHDIESDASWWEARIAATDGELAYVGMDKGEWGGALYRVELATGHVEALSETDGTLCGGHFNPACDPVTAIVVDPKNARCTLVAVGLVHLSEHGRLLRVCDRSFDVLWRELVESKFDCKATRAVVDLAPARGGVWMATTSSLYFFDGERFEALPRPFDFASMPDAWVIGRLIAP